MVNKDDWHMMLVYLVAMRSKDESTHIGAVAVGPHGEIRSVGFNGFVRGIDDFVKERQIPPEKYFWMEHAERNVVYNSSLMGVPLEGCTIYTNGIPCADCARAIIQAGIKEVVYDSEWNSKNQDIWKEHAERSIQMFTEAGVSLRPHEFKPFRVTQHRRGRTEIL